MVDTFDPSTLRLSDGAVKKIHSLSDPDKEQEINLRVYVTGGGCSGFQYGFSFDHEIDVEDTCVSKDGAKLIIDPLSLRRQRQMCIRDRWREGPSALSRN